MTRIVPTTINAGFNFSASAWRSEFSGAEWSMLLSLRGPAAIDIESRRDSARHVFDAEGIATAGWAPGLYAYTVRAISGGDVHPVESGNVRIKPDIAAATAGHDARSEYRRALDAIEAVLAKRATLDQERYRINNRELYRTSIGDLLKLRAFYQQRVNEESSGGRSRFRDLRVAMRPIGR